jgi:hypothetical protein
VSNGPPITRFELTFPLKDEDTCPPQRKAGAP